MKDQNKTKVQLIAELKEMRQRVSELEKNEAGRLHIEKALLESEDRLIEAQKIANLGHYVLDITTGLWTNSAELDDIFGIDKNYKRNVAGWLQIVHPDSKETMSNYLQDNILAQRQKFDKQYKIIHQKTGQEKWVHGLGDLKFDEENNPIEMIGTIQDITARKQTEKAMRESEERLSLFINSAENSYHILDANFKILEINRGALEAIYLAHPAINSKEDVVGQKFEQFYPFLKDELRHFAKVIKTGRKYAKEITVPHPKLGDMVINFRCFKVGDGLGIIAENITERKRVEEALRASEDKYRTLVSHTPAVLWTSDQNGHTSFISSNVEQVYGYTPEEILKAGDRLWFGRIHSEDLAIVQAAFAGLMKTGASFDIEYRIQRRDGEWIWLHDSATRRRKVDSTLHADGVFMDITERKRYMEALQESEAKSKAILEAQPDMMFQLSQDGIHLDFYASSLGDLFLDPKEFVGKSIDEVLPPEVSEKYGHCIRETLKTSQLQTFEYDLDFPDGPRYYDCRMVLYGECNTLAIVRDITERKQAEALLSEANNIINRSPAVAFLWKNAEGWPVEFVSENVEKLFGYSSQEFLQRKITYDKIIHGNDLERVAGEVASNSKKEGLQTFTHDPYRIITKNGDIKWIDDITHIRRDSRGVITHYEGIVYDVTKRKQADEKLRTEKEFTDASLDAQLDTFFLFEPGTGRALRWNRAFREISGYSDEEIARLPAPTSYYSPEDLERAGAFIQKVLEKGAGTIELELICKDGRKIPTEYRVSAVRDDRGEPKHIISIGRDISGRKRAEERIARFGRIFEDSLNEIYLFEADTLKFTQANGASLHNLGYTMEELRKLRPIDLKPEFTTESFTKMLAPLRIGEKAKIVFETVHKRKDQSLYDVEVHLQLLKQEALFAAIILDITERKQAEEEKAKLEEQLRRSQKLETIGTLAGGIAHDFNNILMPIMGYADMALSDLPSSNPLHDDLEHILKGANRAKELVEQILLFSRQVEKERRPFGLHLIIKEALKLLRPSIPTTIEIRQRIDASCEKVLADASQMHQVIVNLCTNAWQAMAEKGGMLTIELKQVEMDAATAKLHPNLNQGEYVRLTITDTGTGMDEATLERIFEPFFTTKAVDKGTGMGLAVVHGIVRSHDGDILVYSEPGKGATFHVYLPTVQAEMEIDKKETEAIVGGQESVLVVDDDKIIANVMKRMLDRLGYKVDVYHNSLEVLKVFRQQPDKYDFLISDLTMPNMTGLDLSEKLQKLRAGFPVIIMTGYGDSLTSATQKQYGIKQVIGKPIVMKELAVAIREVLDS